MKSRVFFVSLGCPKNLVDSEIMAAILERSGYQIVSSSHEADLIIINTCTFIKAANEESIEEIFKAVVLKEKGICRFLVVTGCMPQRYGSILQQEMPEVDLFLGTTEIPRIAHYIDSLLEKQGHLPLLYASDPTFLMDATYPRLLATPPHAAYLKIAEGCSNHCSYCIIPSIRGLYRSRKMDDILCEAEQLAEKGVKELILIAQETTAYGFDLTGKPSLTNLVKKITDIKTISWIRILYTYSFNITDQFLKMMADEEKVCKYIDMPVQHIDDTILQAMRRKDTSLGIRETIIKARHMVPDVALRTSLIVGFPGETRLQFAKLRDFVEESRFDHLGVFTYSREESTVAAGFTNQVSTREKERRRGIIMEIQADISYEINQSLVGTVHEIMIEGETDFPEYDYMGRMKRQAPDIDGITYIKTERHHKSGEVIMGTVCMADEYDIFVEEIIV